ncbi:MAG: hypothetical protein KDI79_29070 [Anaerolineae bacterium]|nr:hypothetical protein [Anaerolineae bacterium]
MAPNDSYQQENGSGKGWANADGNGSGKGWARRYELLSDSRDRERNRHKPGRPGPKRKRPAHAKRL